MRGIDPLIAQRRRGLAQPLPRVLQILRQVLGQGRFGRRPAVVRLPCPRPIACSGSTLDRPCASRSPASILPRRKSRSASEGRCQTALGDETACRGNVGERLHGLGQQTLRPLDPPVFDKCARRHARGGLERAREMIGAERGAASRDRGDESGARDCLRRTPARDGEPPATARRAGAAAAPATKEWPATYPIAGSDFLRLAHPAQQFRHERKLTGWIRVEKATAVLPKRRKDPIEPFSRVLAELEARSAARLKRA